MYKSNFNLLLRENHVLKHVGLFFWSFLSRSTLSQAKLTLRQSWSRSQVSRRTSFDLDRDPLFNRKGRTLKSVPGVSVYVMIDSCCLNWNMSYGFVGYTVAQMLNVQFSKEKMRYLKEAGNGLDSKGKTSPFPPSHYLLSHVMMQKLGYPLLENGVPPQDFVTSKPSAAGQCLTFFFPWVGLIPCLNISYRISRYFQVQILPFGSRGAADYSQLLI